MGDNNAHTPMPDATANADTNIVQRQSPRPPITAPIGEPSAKAPVKTSEERLKGQSLAFPGGPSQQPRAGRSGANIAAPEDRRRNPCHESET